MVQKAISVNEPALMVVNKNNVNKTFILFIYIYMLFLLKKSLQKWHKTKEVEDNIFSQTHIRLSLVYQK